MAALSRTTQAQSSDGGGSGSGGCCSPPPPPPSPQEVKEMREHLKQAKQDTAKQ